MQILPVFLIITNNTIIMHFYIPVGEVALGFQMTIFGAQYMASVNGFFFKSKVLYIIKKNSYVYILGKCDENI